MSKRNTVPATLARLEPNGLKWLTNERKKILANGGNSIGVSTALRAIVSGLSEAKVDFSSCRSEFEISDRVRDLMKTATAPATEVHANA